MAAAGLASPFLGGSATAAEIENRPPCKLPPKCFFVGLPTRNGPLGLDWKVNLETKNNAARGVLGPALVAQGWSYHSHGLASGSWVKAGLMITVAEASARSGDYPRLVVHPFVPEIQKTR